MNFFIAFKSVSPNKVCPTKRFGPTKTITQRIWNVRTSNRRRFLSRLEYLLTSASRSPDARDRRWRSRSRPNWLPEVPVGWGVRVRNQSGPGAGLILTTSLARLIITVQRLDLATSMLRWLSRTYHWIDYSPQVLVAVYREGREEGGKKSALHR